MLLRLLVALSCAKIQNFVIPQMRKYLLVLQKNDMRMLGTHTRGRPSSGFQHLDEFLIHDLLVLKLVHASACLDAGDGVHTS